MQTRLDFAEVPEFLLRDPQGLTFLLGGPDTGKTTLFKNIARRFGEAGIATALVDADVGQSTIGPPTTIGMSVLEGGPEAAFDTPATAARGLYFVGSNNPVSRLTQVIVGSRVMVDRALMLGAGSIIFDSSGLVAPPYGHILKYHKFELLKPRRIVALEKEDELSELLSLVLSCFDIEVLRVKPAAEARIVSATKRAGYRQKQYRRYFKGAKAKTLAIADLALYPAQFLSRSKDLPGLMVGLQNKHWETVSIGIIQSAEDNLVTIRAPWPTDEAICGLQAGYIKLSRELVELEHLPSRYFL